MAINSRAWSHACASLDQRRTHATHDGPRCARRGPGRAHLGGAGLLERCRAPPGTRLRARRASGRGPIGVGGGVRPRARTAGSWPRGAARRRPLPCRLGGAGRGGTPRRSARPGAAPSSRRWGLRTPCGCSMSRAFCTTGTTRPASRARRAGRPARWTTARWASGWPRPAGGVTPGWPARSSGPTHGPLLRPAVGRRASQRPAGVRPGRRGPSRGGLGPAPRACRRRGSPVTASMGLIGGGGGGWRPHRRPLAWRCRARSRSGGAGDHARSRRSGPPGRRRAGRGAVPAMGPRVRGGTTGPGTRWPNPWRRTGAAGGGCGAVCALRRTGPPPVRVSGEGRRGAC